LHQTLEIQIWDNYDNGMIESKKNPDASVGMLLMGTFFMWFFTIQFQALLF
jgi:hypothetical protein